MVHVDHSVSYSSSSGDTQMAALICVLLVLYLAKQEYSPLLCTEGQGFV